ncbi:MAG: DUF167 domain-containing protein [Cytophagaceae bacterium]|jgi:hypothetical protein|nr:DUF167 domain-containing protein [Cytophagaceae bacterium]
MIIEIKVKPNARKDEVSVSPEGLVRLSIKAPPVDGKANEYLVGLLSRIFGVTKSSITILTGASSTRKRVEIAGNDKDLAVIWENALTKGLDRF